MKTHTIRAKPGPGPSPTPVAAPDEALRRELTAVRAELEIVRQQRNAALDGNARLGALLGQRSGAAPATEARAAAAG